jgi:peptidoglycan/LPS O-acetylase OafA/YrhL
MVGMRGVGQLSVAIFFSLSGFLMGYLYLNKNFSFEAGTLFVISRFSRIAPAYLIVVLISFLIYNFYDSSFPIAISYDLFLRHLFFSGNVSVLWSIPPEVQFYALFFIFWCLLSLSKKGLFLPISIFSFVFLFLSYYGYMFSGVIVFSKSMYFLFGMIAGCLRFYFGRSPILENSSKVFQYGFVLWGGMLFFENIYGGGDVFWLNIANALFVSLFVFSFSFEKSKVCCFLNNKILMGLGKWSFSLYLTHVFVLHYFSGLIAKGVLGSLLVIFLSISLSCFFYIIVEYPGSKYIKIFMNKCFRLFVKN